MLACHQSHSKWRSIHLQRFRQTPCQTERIAWCSMSNHVYAREFISLSLPRVDVERWMTGLWCFLWCYSWPWALMIFCIRYCFLNSAKHFQNNVFHGLQEVHISHWSDPKVYGQTRSITELFQQSVSLKTRSTPRATNKQSSFTLRQLSQYFAILKQTIKRKHKKECCGSLSPGRHFKHVLLVCSIQASLPWSQGPAPCCVFVSSWDAVILLHSHCSTPDTAQVKVKLSSHFGCPVSSSSPASINIYEAVFDFIAVLWISYRKLYLYIPSH